jgi:outer membrane protein assembly factor BamB
MNGEKILSIRKNEVPTIIAIILMLTMAISLVAIPAANAHTPPWTIPSYAYIVASPTTVGAGQQVAIYMWVDDPLPGAQIVPIVNPIRRSGYTLTITSPTGKVTTQTWATISDTTGLQRYSFTPTEVGNYTCVFSYAGQTYTWTSTTPGADTAYTGDVFTPANATLTLTVQQTPVASTFINYPLPTEYWTYPIEGRNYNWYTIASNWLGSPQIVGAFQRDGTAPNSAHIMWTKALQSGGVVGGSNVGIAGETFYEGETYDVRWNTPIIMYGKLYYPLPLGPASSGGGFRCVDLRTGEENWYNPDLGSQSFGQIYDYQDPNQHGAIGDGFLWDYAAGSGIMNGTDPWTGTPLINLVGVPKGTNVNGPNGELLIYTLDSTGKWLSCWNSTVVLGAAAGRRGLGDLERNASEGYSWNITIPALPLGEWTINTVAYDDFMLCTQGSFGERGNVEGANITVISLKGSSKGSVLWTQHFPAAADSVTRMLEIVDPETRVFVFRDKETLVNWGYSVDDGSKLWGPTAPTGAFDYFHADESWNAYGKFYTAGMGGVVYCYDIKNGTLLWTYGNGGLGNNTNSGLETVYGNYPVFVGAIADQKLYLFTSEHTPNTPQFKGAKIRCIDANTGQELWTMESWVTTSGGGAAALNPRVAIADGYLVYLNGYDMQIYCVGKGPSVTEVTASPEISTYGSSVLIKGSVMDIASGTQQNEQAARFPNGVPAVSDASMEGWMEYVYMQKPRPMNVVGVNVTLSVLDSNGNNREIGTVTSDSDGFFSYQWTPDIPGKFTVTASFAGSNSYWPSHAVTAFGVDSAPEPTAEPIPTPISTSEQYFIPVTVGMIVAIVAFGTVLALLMLRKRP